MNLFDIVGPVMVGPSSSHTAGAVKIGLVARTLLGEDVAKAEILFHGSFLATGKGHGTDKAIVAGLLGYTPDDKRIPNSLELAKQAGVSCVFGSIDLGDAHPNTVKLHLVGVSGKMMDMMAASVGGGRISVSEIDGMTAHFSAEYPTLIVRNEDKPGLVANVTALLQEYQINIATMQLYRSGRGDQAVMVIECDEQVPDCVAVALKQLDGVRDLTYYPG
ncbi:MAG: L-serine ammonia-lyase, iron-sulfur-dependent subunit beta [Lachnospiraceae bacterium]|jgi:L-serine dehydratase|nr:L-serine ammonia-lyase, iron-sulfur-dependent, subunit beta [Lachnospiraceae bacterium]MBQ3794235.1 L-serine ammonia-lyase, iron-sulfur-dependent subunit beta [Lachnospiraceae bacterium]MBQ5376356.1 L-serine ammonia-lyase, iron-sulfur-dependent subunit beta [Lachnospiraceae bacterium]